MSSPLRRRLRHARRWVGYSAMAVLVLAAVLVAVANQLLPLVERHPEKIAAWLGERVGQRVQFDRARGEWTRRGPRFTLDALRVGEGDATLHVGRAELLVAVYSGLLPGEPLTELKVRGLDLTLEQLPDRRWRVLGLPRPAVASTDPLELLEGFGELQVEKASLRLRVPRLDTDVRVPRVDLRLRVADARIRAGVELWSRSGSPPLAAVADLERGSFDGRLWLGGERLVVGDWAELAAATGLRLLRGQGQVDAWADLVGQRVRQVTLRAELSDIELAAALPLVDADGTSHAVKVHNDSIEALLRWRSRGGDWHVDAPRLRIGEGGHVARLDGLRLRGGDALEVRAPLLDLAGAAPLVVLLDRLPAPFRRWLQQAGPSAVVRDLSISGRSRQEWRASARVESLQLRPVGHRPGLRGLAGMLAMDARGGVLRLRPGQDAEFDWPGALRQPLPVSLQGSVAWWREGDGWGLGTPDLRVRGQGFGAHARARLGLQGDGTAPTLDLAAWLEPSDFATAKKFWILNKMPPATVKWLDEALVEGRVLDGRILVAGDLDDWPFHEGQGRFDARASIRDARLRFSPEWPVAQDLDVDVVFDGPGFEVAGRAVLAGNRIESLRGGIADFGRPRLDLDLASSGRAEALQSLMRASPLAKSHGEHLGATSIAGEASVSLALGLPLGAAGGERRLEGVLDLKDARLADSRWDIAFASVNGRTRFGDRGFATEPLRVLFEQQPALFSLSVGEAYTGEAGLAALGTLRGRFPPQALSRRYQAIRWLDGWLQGSSDWSAVVRIPATSPGREAAPAQLQLESDLLGVEVGLPAPLRKAADRATVFELSAPLPVEKGEVRLRLGETLRMQARMRGQGGLTGVALLGRSEAVTMPAQGLLVRGEAEELDVAGWIAFAAAGEGASGLRSVDVGASTLVFLDHPFRNSRVQLERDAGSTKMRVAGTGIEGAVDIPAELARGVQGRFAKLHFAAAGVPSAAPVQADTDPARIPPLRFTIDDLRMGAAQLGQADLRTVPVANGMRIERFHTQSKTVGLDASGEWLRVGGGSRSSFKLDFRADSLGKMMDAFGFAGMVDGGRTRASLTGSWPGSPGAFALANLGGQLHAEVGEGRLLDVEPGGSGRVLGLISLAELPRRLSLDFSDFFAKGFAFNSIKGDFTFADGQARTDNLRIDGPSAEIRVSGSTGLRSQTYDQRVEVLPKAGGVLPAIGMLAGGPAGAAVGAVAQAVLNKPLKQSTRTVYRVTGPWKAPAIDVVEKGPAEAPPAAAPGSGGKPEKQPTPARRP